MNQSTGLFKLLALVSLAVCIYSIQAQAFEPLPATARPSITPDPNKGYAIVDQGHGVYLFTDGAYWAMAVASDDSYDRDNDRGNDNDGRRSQGKTLCVVDQPQGFFSNVTYINAVREILTRSGANTVSDMVYSHHHKDHIGNAGWLKQAFPRAEIHAHLVVQKRLSQRKDVDRPVPTKAYSSNFTLPRFCLSLYDFGSAHTPGNLAIYHRNSKVLMFVDVIFPGWTAFRDLAQAEYTPDFVESQSRILNFDFQVLVGGHLTRLGTRADVLLQIQYFSDIIANAQYGLATVQAGVYAGQLGTFDPTSVNFQNYWALFEVYLNAVAQVCYDKTMNTWSGRLGAVDVFTMSHCNKMVESLRID